VKTIEKFYRKIAEYLAKRVKPQTIQFTISVSFTIISVCSMGILGVTLYNRFVNRMEDMTIESSEQLLNQTAINLETYLRNMRRISDAMYYSVIKDKDLAVDSVDEEMNLLYEANKDNLISIACYTNDGKLVAAAPVTNEKDNSDIVGQEWFVNAVDQMENLHFSTPHVQNLFDNATYRYYWVVSLSRAVELTSNGNSTLGVLLVDMNYSSIEQLFNKANTDNSSEYVYLMDSDGEIIYHPKQKLIYTNLYEENNLEAVHYDDGSRSQETAWKLLQTFKGYLQSDGYAAYNIFEGKKEVCLVGCLAHIRRHYEVAKEENESLAGYVLAQIQQLYRIEQIADQEELTYEQRMLRRQEQALPILEQLEKWMETAYPKVLPKSRMGQAIAYAYQLWPRMRNYLKDGRLKIDNNLAENAIRPIALSRKNFLFCGNHEAAQNTAIICSLLASCKASNINPREWLTEVIALLPYYAANKEKDLKELLPHCWESGNSKEL